jgi:hypothetical protein
MSEEMTLCNVYYLFTIFSVSLKYSLIGVTGLMIHPMKIIFWGGIIKMKKHKNNIGKAFVAVVIAMTLLVSVSAAVANREIMSNSVLKLKTDDGKVVEEFLGADGAAWDVTFGGTGTDRAWSVQQTNDGGFVLLGWTNSFGAGGYDFYVVKTNASGVMEWSQTYGGTAADYGYSVEQTSDGGYILAGYTSSFGAGNQDVWLVKTDASGLMEWNQTLGTDRFQYGYSVDQTSDGGYIIGGTNSTPGGTKSDVWLVKTDASGVMEWNQTFVGSSDDDFCYSVEQTSDGGYILGGYTVYSFIDTDIWVIKTNASGVMEWNQTYGGTGTEYGYSVEQTSDGGYIIGGSSNSFSSLYQSYVVKTNASGVMEWNQTYGGTGTEYGYSVEQTSDGGYILGGYTNSFGAGGYDFYVVKTNASGVMEWNQTYGGTAADYGYSVEQTSDGGYILAGYTDSFGAGGSDFWLVKVVGSPPYVPSNPNPADGGIDAPETPILSWTGGDPDGDPVTYDVYFGGTSPPPLVASHQSATTYNAGLQVGNTTYFWKIVSYDKYNASARGPIWSFTTEFVDYPTLTVDVEGNGLVFIDPPGEISTGVYREGTVVTLSAYYQSPTWEFSHWSGDATGSDNPLAITMDTHKHITAHFVETELTLTLQIEGAGTVTKDPDQSAYALGTEVELTANPNPGWMFSHWSGDLTGSDNPATITMTDDKVVVASFVVYPELGIGDITGGLFKIKADVTNEGVGDALDVEWNITVTPTLGLIFTGQETANTILRIPAGDSAIITSDVILGIGRVDITVTASTDTSTASETVTGFVLGFYINV